jgi:hypothetical protein
MGDRTRVFTPEDDGTGDNPKARLEPGDGGIFGVVDEMSTTKKVIIALVIVLIIMFVYNRRRVSHFIGGVQMRMPYWKQSMSDHFKGKSKSGCRCRK